MCEITDWAIEDEIVITELHGMNDVIKSILKEIV